MLAPSSIIAISKLVWGSLVGGACALQFSRFNNSTGSQSAQSLVAITEMRAIQFVSWFDIANRGLVAHEETRQGNRLVATLCTISTAGCSKIASDLDGEGKGGGVRSPQA